MADVPFSVEVPGGALVGVRSGDGDPLLVLHGGPGLSDYTGMFADELAGWDAVRYTQRGVPPSTTAGPFTVAGHVTDATAVLDQLGIDTAVVLGHSFGGYLAMRLAVLAPGRVRGLVLVDSLGAAGDGGLVAFGVALAERTSAGDLAKISEFDAQAGAVAGTPGADEFDLAGLRLMWPAYFTDPSAAPPPPDGLRLSHACNAETMQSLRDDEGAEEFARRLGEYAGPVEIVAGTGGPMPAEASRATGALFTDAHVTELPDAGHFVWHELPGSVAAALDRLAARL